MSSQGFDVNRDGSHDDYADAVDYDKRTWTHTENGKATRSALVLGGDKPHRATTIFGKTTIAATNGGQLTLHVHADRDVVVRACSTKPCTTTKVAKGDHDVAIDGFEVEILASGATYPIHVETVQGDEDYPPATTPW